MLEKLHHVAYRCKDAAETTDFYTNVLGLKLAASLVQDKVPSLGVDEPHNHIFFQMRDGSFIAFFDLKDDSGVPVTPVENDWVQHLALEVRDQETIDKIVSRLKSRNCEVIGPTNHEICQSWYFYDPSGHRLELVLAANVPEVWSELEEKAPSRVTAWSASKR